MENPDNFSQPTFNIQEYCGAKSLTRSCSTHFRDKKVKWNSQCVY